MNDSFDEHLRNRLNALDSDVSGVGMAGPAAARHRAAQRTRNQVTGSLLAGVAVVAVGFFGIVLPVLTTDDPIAQTDTDSPTPSATRSSTATPGDDDGLGAALMTTEDIANEAGLSWTESSDRIPAPECAPVVDDVGAAEQARIDFVAPEDNGLSQDLILVPPGTAGDAFTALREQILACLPERGSETLSITDDLNLVDVGDEGWMTRYFVDPNDPDAPTVVVGVVRYEDVLSVTIDTHPTRDSANAVDFQTPSAAAERMCRVLFDTDCVGEARFTDQTGGTDNQSGTTTDESGEPAPELLDLADDPYLTDDDVNPVGTYSGFARAEDYTEDDPYTYRCLNNLDDVGADTVVRGHWFHELEGSIAEFVLRMPDTDSAFRIITAHTILPEQCGDIPDTHEQTVSEPAVIDVDGAEEALVWTVDQRALPEDPGSDPGFTGVAMARRANVVVVVSFGAFGDPTEGGWADYAAQTLAQALDRATR